jgi:hypothetical protein
VCQANQPDSREQRAGAETPADPPGACEPSEARGVVPAGWVDGQAPRDQVPPIRSQSPAPGSALVSS